MKLEDVLKLIELHMELNCISAKEYAERNDVEMSFAHIGGVTALRMLKEDLIEEYGELE